MLLEATLWDSTVNISITESSTGKDYHKAISSDIKMIPPVISWLMIVQRIKYTIKNRDFYIPFFLTYKSNRRRKEGQI
jgi:hypothetical protein